ncbi:MAG: serine/threonine protein kinase [Planctomycetes bacterium]|nr:serine/threonine protein kinase [Planctomycetota bacterium]
MEEHHQEQSERDDGQSGASPDRRKRGPTLVADVSEHVGQRVGRYKLLTQIGEGGFGVVYLAEQEEPVRRSVAFKIIKLGMDTKQVIARFEAERQALAMMDHPNIAKVYDAGATDTGRPYFVMELVRGEPITEYCDKNNLSVEQRLLLFRQICLAVQHAHQKGIIHRDIKPTNVMITLHDGEPMPKVIDFGIAKATNARLTEKTIFTEYRQLVGTPEYMSPEQAEMSGIDIDTRSDIYSLGVLLYELLTGTTPFDKRKLRSAAYGEIQRIIREETPHKPSTRLSTLDALASIAAQRRTEPKRLRLMVRGDLDWIVMKSLEKDRTRRYETANDFAHDIARYLNNEPVIAGPPGAAYRIKKFISRNKAGVAAVVIIAAILILGVAGTSWGLLKALDEMKRADLEATNALVAANAEKAARQDAQQAALKAQRAEAAAEAARAEAQQRSDELEVVTDFQMSLLSGIDPEAMGLALYTELRTRVRDSLQADQITSEEREVIAIRFDQTLRRANATDVALRLINEHVLGRAVREIEHLYADQPVVLAALEQTIASTYVQIGRYESALPLQEAALRVRRTELGNDHPDTLSSINEMGYLLESMGRFDESLIYYEEGLERCRRVLGESHPDTFVALNNLGLLLSRMNRDDEAYVYAQEALEGQRRVLGNDHPDTLNSITNVGSLLMKSRRYDEALGYFREALDGNRRIRGSDHPETLTALNNMGNLLQHMGRLDEALEHHREALMGRRRLLGDEHPDTLVSILNMGVLLMIMDNSEEALTHFQEALEGLRQVLGEDSPSTLIAVGYVGVVLKSMGRLEEAEPYFREALEGTRRTFGENHQRTMGAIHNMGRLLRDLRHLEEAESLGATAVKWARESLPPAHPTTAAFLASYGKTLAELERFGEAEANLLEAHEITAAASGPAQRRRIDLMRSLVDLYDAWHEADPEDSHDAAAAQWRARLAELDTSQDDDGG